MSVLALQQRFQNVLSIDNERVKEKKDSTEEEIWEEVEDIEGLNASFLIFIFQQGFPSIKQLSAVCSK